MISSWPAVEAQNSPSGETEKIVPRFSLVARSFSQTLDDHRRAGEAEAENAPERDPEHMGGTARAG